MSAMLGRVVIVIGTEKSEGDGEVVGVVVDGFVLDSLEPRYIVACLEEGTVSNPKKPIDGALSFAVGTLICVSHRDLAMAPAPQEMKEAAGKLASLNREGRRSTFRPGEGWQE